MAQVNYRTMAISLTPEQREQLQTLMFARGVSMSLLVRWAVTYWLEQGAPVPQATNGENPERS